MNEFGNTLRKARIARHLRQKDVAKAIGKTNSYVCELEKGSRGSNITPFLVVKLAEYLHIPVEVLLDKSDIQYNPNSHQFKQYLKITKSKVKSARVVDGFKTIRALFAEISRVVADIPGGVVLVEKAQKTLDEIDASLTL